MRKLDQGLDIELINNFSHSFVINRLILIIWNCMRLANRWPLARFNCQSLKQFGYILPILSFFIFNTTMATEMPSLEISLIQEASEPNAVEKMDKPEKKEQKILVLVIASDEMSVYLELQKIWRTYMHLDKEHVEVYFIKANPDLATPCEISGDVIWCKVPHGLAPGIIQKTLLSMEIMLPRLKEFDYVVRTNLSSFYVFPRLFAFLDTLPKTGCYSAHIDGDPRFYVTTWGCGAGIILSPDLVEMLVHYKQALWTNLYVNLANDDLIIAAFFRDEKIKLLSAPREDILIKEIWEQRKDMIPPAAFHFRVKNPHADLRLSDDVYVHHELRKTFYPQAAKSE